MKRREAQLELFRARKRLRDCCYEPLFAALYAEVEYWEYRVSRCSGAS